MNGSIVIKSIHGAVIPRMTDDLLERLAFYIWRAHREMNENGHDIDDATELELGCDDEEDDRDCAAWKDTPKLERDLWMLTAFTCYAEIARCGGADVRVHHGETT